MVVTLFLLCLGCQSEGSRSASRFSKLPEIRDLEDIEEDGKLVALVAYSATSYFLYRGQPMGYEYEMLQRLASDLDLELELKISRNLNSMLDILKEGEVDIVAHGLAVTGDRKKQVSFTRPLYRTKQVLVQRKPDNWSQMKWLDIQRSLVHDPVELIGDTVSVRRNSSYYRRLINLSDEFGGTIHINTLDGDLSTDEIIKMVADGTIKYTIADQYLARINASYFPQLDIDVPVSLTQRIAWAVHDQAPCLLEAIDEWLEDQKKDTDYYVIYNKYYKNERSFKRRVKSDFFSLNNQQISPYDDLIKENAKRIGWDWRLLASLIYQESRFQPQAKSWTGALGLMQMLPATAKEMGINNLQDAAENIKGGANYLKILYDRFDHVTDSIQRTKLTMAAYNCGYSHVKDAQALAHFNELDSTQWDGHVSDMIVALSYPGNYNKDFIKFGYVNGKEPFQYVDQIFERYEHYTRFIGK